MYVYVICPHILILERKVSLKTLGNGASSGRREEGEDKVAMHINNQCMHAQKRCFRQGPSRIGSEMDTESHSLALYICVLSTVGLSSLWQFVWQMLSIVHAPQFYRNPHIHHHAVASYAHIHHRMKKQNTSLPRSMLDIPLFHTHIHHASKAEEYKHTTTCTNSTIITHVCAHTLCSCSNYHW